MSREWHEESDDSYFLEFEIVCPTLCALWAYVLVRYLDIEGNWNKTQNGFILATLGNITSRDPRTTGQSVSVPKHVREYSQWIPDSE